MPRKPSVRDEIIRLTLADFRPKQIAKLLRMNVNTVNTHLFISRRDQPGLLPPAEPRGGKRWTFRDIPELPPPNPVRSYVDDQGRTINVYPPGFADGITPEKTARTTRRGKSPP